MGPRTVIAFGIGIAILASPSAASAPALPILDMHLHTTPVTTFGPPPHAMCVPVQPGMPPIEAGKPWSQTLQNAMKSPKCSRFVWSAKSDDELMTATIAEMRKHNVYGVLSYDPGRVARWTKAAPDRFYPAVTFAIGGRKQHDVETLRKLASQGRLKVFGEVENQYEGVAPDDPRMEPYWALMEELDIPVAYHMGSGPPGSQAVVPTYRVALSNPLLLEPVLVRHPKLRVSVMHYGEPFIDSMIALLGAYPQVYIDLGGIQWQRDQDRFNREIKELIDAGFAKRIMFGSDQMSWPGLIGESIRIVEAVPFLSEAQKRDIYYNNAARFLQLSKDEIASHHGGSLPAEFRGSE